LYPDGDKTPEEIAAEKEASDKEIEDNKTPEQKAQDIKDAEAKEIEDKKALDDKKAADDKAKEEGLITAEEEGLITAEDITFPEGVQVDADVQKDFIEIVNDREMSVKDKSQALVDLQAKLYATAHQSKVDTWVADVNADKKFVGDDGTKLPENLALAKTGMEALKIEGLSEYLDASGEGNNPLMVEAFMKIGAAIGEDTFIVGGKGAETGKRSAAEILYGPSK